MVLNEDFLSPKEILDRFPRLSRDKLTYWANKGYLRTLKESKGNRDYMYFYKAELPLIEQAYKLIVMDKVKDKEAFALLRSNNNSRQQLAMFKN